MNDGIIMGYNGVSLRYTTMKVIVRIVILVICDIILVPLYIIYIYNIYNIYLKQPKP